MAAGRLLLIAAAAIVVLAPYRAFVQGGVQVPRKAPATQRLAEETGFSASSIKGSISTFDESGDNVKSASVVFYFVLGLIFPLLGGFNFGLVLAALGYGLSFGALTDFAKKKIPEYSDQIDDVAGAGLKAGEYALKSYNFVAAKVKENL
mmetsp:Transcript_28847/g.54071  ORF Transcript_28847/g.54071 Transcript_28847/m.54071 type:complete len:149 (-) Transcript_28847:105-551(-)